MKGAAEQRHGACVSSAFSRLSGEIVRGGAEGHAMVPATLQSTAAGLLWSHTDTGWDSALSGLAGSCLSLERRSLFHLCPLDGRFSILLEASPMLFRVSLLLCLQPPGFPG